MYFFYLAYVVRRIRRKKWSKWALHSGNRIAFLFLLLLLVTKWQILIQGHSWNFHFQCSFLSLKKKSELWQRTEKKIIRDQSQEERGFMQIHPPLAIHRSFFLQLLLKRANKRIELCFCLSEYMFLFYLTSHNNPFWEISY